MTNGMEKRPKKIRYAVVGLGHIAQQAVLPAFKHARRNSTLRALVSGDPEKLSVLGDEYRVRIRGRYDEYEQVLQQVDAVYIATPNTEHAQFAVRAAHAGVHVLCEKPLATTDADCDAGEHPHTTRDRRRLGVRPRDLLHQRRPDGFWNRADARARVGDRRPALGIPGRG
jgi:predicted dehydrogenase